MRWAGAAGVLAAIAAIPAWSFASAASKMGSTHPACTRGPTTTSAWRAELAKRLGEELPRPVFAVKPGAAEGPS